MLNLMGSQTLTRLIMSFPGLPVLKYVLTPRIKATYVAFDSMKNYLDAIYDVTVVYEGKDRQGQQVESMTMTGESMFTCAKRVTL